MSTQAPAPPSHVTPDTTEIKIVSHSNLFYWWPVWAVGYILAFLTLIDGHFMAIVPSGTEAQIGRRVEGMEKLGPRDLLVFPEKHKDTRIENPRLHVADEKGFGVLFAIILI